MAAHTIVLMAVQQSQPESEQPAYLQPYARAVRRHGAADLRALLWASRQTQATRFAALLSMADPSGLTVLDLGCGNADLLDFLIARGHVPQRYVGLEGVADLAESARKKGHAMAEIIGGDFVRDARAMDVGADITFCSGALNTLDPAEFYQTIRSAFEASRQALVFNFLSSPLLAGMSYLRWYERGDVLRFARSLTREVDVRDDYLEGDCTMALRKAAVAS
jgi:hypothetical protein